MIELKIIPSQQISDLLARPEKSLHMPRTPDVLRRLRQAHETLIYCAERVAAPAILTPDMAQRILIACHPDHGYSTCAGTPLPLLRKATELQLWYDPDEFDQTDADSENMLHCDWRSGGAVVFPMNGGRTLKTDIVVFDLDTQKRYVGEEFSTDPAVHDDMALALLA